MSFKRSRPHNKSCKKEEWGPPGQWRGLWTTDSNQIFYGTHNYLTHIPMISYLNFLWPSVRSLWFLLICEHRCNKPCLVSNKVLPETWKLSLSQCWRTASFRESTWAWSISIENYGDLKSASIWWLICCRPISPLIRAIIFKVPVTHIPTAIGMGEGEALLYCQCSSSKRNKK